MNILNPKNSITILGIFTIIISLFYLIFFDKFGSPESYILYLLMSYSLVINVIKYYNLFKNKLNIIIDKNPFLKKYKEDLHLRYKLGLLTSLSINIIYALFKLVTGIIYHSLWFISLSLYYILLSLVRSNILKQELNKKNSLQNEYIKYRNTGILLLFINILLTFIVLIIVNEKIIIIYPTYYAITAAVYTFYLNFTSIYNLIKYREFKRPLITAAKVINVITSLVSLISLEMILIPTFGENNTLFFEIMIFSTGGAVALIITIISLYMIIKATDNINPN